MLTTISQAAAVAIAVFLIALIALTYRNTTQQASVGKQNPLAHQVESGADNAKSEKQSTDAALANYTFWLTAFTGILALATIALVIATAGLWQYVAEQAGDMKDSIAEARRSSEAAKIAADAAKDSVALADRTAERQLRAYVFISDGTIQLIENDTAIDVTVVLKNSGQTPAYDFRTTTRIEIKPPPAQGSPYTDLVPPEAKSIIPPGASDNIGPNRLVFAPSALQDIRNGIQKIYVWGRADYIDAFKMPRYFIFRSLNGREITHTDMSTGKVIWRGFGLMPSSEGYEAN